MTVKMPTSPTASDCAIPILQSQRAAADLDPPAGTYRFAVRGKRKLSGSQGYSRKLPKEMRLIVLPAESFGQVKCFVAQRRYSDSLADTSTFAIRGDDVYLTRLLVQSGGQIADVLPRPPVQSIAGSGSVWSGQFRGPTSGSYRMELLGRKSMTLRGERVTAAGIQSEFVFNGDFTGRESSERWIATETNEIISERVHQERNFGVDVISLDYTARLAEGPGER